MDQGSDQSLIETRCVSIVALTTIGIYGMSFVNIVSGRLERLEMTPRFLGALGLFLSIFTLEYYIFGPNSFADMNSEGGLSIPIDQYLNAHGNEQLSHRFAAGQDMSIMWVGTQYVQFERFLHSFFPAWVVLLLHKILIGSLSFGGIYLLMRRIAPEAYLATVSVAVALSVGHPYLSGYSSEFGTGFAAIPLIVYLCVGYTGAKRYWWFAILAAIIMALASPMKVFPALLVAFIAAVILFYPVNLRRTVGAFALLVFISILNWHEVLYALIQTNGLTSRGFDLSVDGASPLPHAAAMTLTSVFRNWSPTILIATAFCFLAISRSPYLGRGLLAFVWILIAITFADAFPWEIIGLGFLNRLSHQQYMTMALPTVAAILGAHALSGLTSWRSRLRPTTVLIIFACSIIALQKYQMTMLFAGGGGQANYHEISALEKPDWHPVADYRTITFYETPHPNIVANFYGFDTFDGHPFLYLQNWSQFWLAALHSNKGHSLATRLGWYWKYWDETKQHYNADQHVRFDLMQVANVRYVFSPLPLSSKYLVLRHAAKRQDWVKGRPSMFAGRIDYVKQRLRSVLSGGDIFVYELQNALPRVYAAQDILPTTNEVVDYDQVAAAAANRKIVVTKNAAAILGNASPSLSVTSFRPVANGYEVSVQAPEGGVLVINTTYLPWWEAQANGVPVPVFTADNGIHIAVQVPRGSDTISVRYSRPMLKDKLSAFLP